MTLHELTGRVLSSSVSHRPVMTTRIVLCPEEGQEFFPEMVVENVAMSIPGRHILLGMRIRAKYVLDARRINLVSYYEVLGEYGAVTHSDDLRERT